jgi:8-oxo-dGTP pyrophosphatase MutT (NUDIX family)
MLVMSSDFEERLRAVISKRDPVKHDLDDVRDAAVLIPVIGEAEPTLIMTLRSEDLPSHKGQISFPGGSIDPGESAIEAALRETHEEIDLDPEKVRVLGEMDSMPTWVSGFLVHPVVGWLDQKPELKPNEAEVAAILEVPISSLTEEIRAEPGFTHGGRTFPTEAWIWDENVIWGFTARVLRVFIGHLAEAGLAEPIPGPDPWEQMQIPDRMPLDRT